MMTTNPMSRRTAPIRVLIVDDSAMIRKVLSLGLSRDPMIDVVGTASSADQARDMITTLQPDVMTLDIEMPRMDGVTFLRQLIPVHPLPTVIISSATQEGAAVTLRALEAGAVDVIAKPTMDPNTGLHGMMDEVCARVRAAASARPVRMARPAGFGFGLGAVMPASAAMRSRVIAIGASTGGVQALAQLLQVMPPDAPGIVIVQHMPQGFTRAFADRLDTLTTIRVREAQDGDQVRPGLALIAPGGDQHMRIAGRAPHWRVTLAPGAPVCYSRPSVDILFQSVAEQAGPRACAALLTGMGKDGAAGMAAIRRAGGVTIAQDEATSVVWGMPAAAVERGAASQVLPLADIAPALLCAAAQPEPHHMPIRNPQKGTA
jgi:two-component system, chemotaxis family, protein-glutamate methylesterase/glutaminase